MNPSHRELPYSLALKDPSKRLHGLDIPIIALTGGIATGKSSVAKCLEEMGVAHIDADLLIKEIYRQKESFDFISTIAPHCIENDTIDFLKLREFAFLKEENREELETFLYKKLPEAFWSKRKEFPKAKWLLYNVPLLFEKNLHTLVDQTICVYIPEALQRERLALRDKISPKLIDQILNAQWPIEKKKERSHWVLNNEGSSEELPDKCKILLNQIFN